MNSVTTRVSAPVRLRALRPSLMTAASTIGLLMATAGAPGVALAADECGTLVPGATVHCPAQVYQQIMYGGVGNNNTVIVDGGTIISTGGAVAGSAYLSGTGNLTLNASAVTAQPITNNQTASATRGVFVLTTSGAASASAYDVVTAGDGGVGVVAQGTTGATVSAHNVSTTGLGSLLGAPAFGIQAITTGAGNSLVTANSVSTLGVGAHGVYATAANGNTTVSVNSVTTAGSKAYGVNFTGRDVIIDAGSITTTGDGANAIYGSGAISTTVTAGTIRTSGNSTTVGGVSLSSGVNVSGGTVNITTSNVLSSGLGGLGIIGIANGNITVHAGTTATTGDVLLSNGTYYAPTGMSLVSSNGNIDLTSASMSTSGTVATGLRARATTGSITINSGTVSTLGSGSTAISAIAGGAVNVTSTGAISTKGNAITLAPVNGSDVGVTTRYADGIYATSNNGAVTINASGPISTAGNGAAGIRASAATGITITSSSITTGGVTTNLGGEDVDATGIEAFTTNGPIVINSGAVTVSGAGSVGIAADSLAGAVTVNVTGNVTSSSATGVGVVASSDTGDVTVNISAGAKASGGVAGVGAVGVSGVARITNAGRIDNTSASSVYGALTTFEATVLDTSGTIAGANGLAVMTTDAVDTLTFRATSTTTGSVQTFGGADTINVAAGASLQGLDAGAGNDVLNLTGTGVGAARGASQSGFAGWDNIETVNVTGGNWTLSGAAAWDALSIASGASLTTGQTTGLNYGLGVGSSGSLSIANAGSLTLQNTGRALTAANDSISMTGAGAYNIVGGALAVNSGLNGFTGQVGLTGNSQLVALGVVGGGVNVASGSTLTIGGVLTTNNGVTTVSGPGTTGAITGAIVDNGLVVFNRSDSYAYGGALSGSGSLVKNGAGILTLTGSNTFTGTTTVNGGAITYGGAQTLSALNLSAGTINLATGSNTIGGLSGAGGTINLASGANLVAGATSGTFAGVLAGTGSLTVNGGPSGGLTLTGANSFTGGTTVTSGLLRVNGSLASGVIVNSGGTLGGSGTINGNVVIGSGGFLNPGNSPGTLTVNGAFTFNTGSTYTVEVTPTQADRLVATGAVTIQSGSTLAITPTAAISAYGRYARFNVLTGASLTGTFSTVTNTLAFLTPHLHYSATGLDLALTRNDVSFASLAANPNQAAVAAAAEATGYGAPLYMSLVVLDQPGSQTAYSALSGEGYAGVGQALFERSQIVRAATLERLSDAEGTAVWGKVLGASVRGDGSAAYAEVQDDVSGVLFGGDGEVGGWRLGAAVGYLKGSIDVLNGSADATTTQVSAYAGGKLGSISLRLGAGYASHSTDMSRQIVYTGFTNSATAGVDATNTELSGEAALAFSSGKLRVEPFASVTWDSLDTDGATEAGGGMAQLTLGSHKQSLTAARLGVRGALPLNDNGLALTGSAAWRGLSGDTDGAVSASISGQSFVVKAAPLDESAFELGLRLDGQVGERGHVNLSYRGVLGDVWSSNSLEAGFSFKF